VPTCSHVSITRGHGAKARLCLPYEFLPFDAYHRRILVTTLNRSSAPLFVIAFFCDRSFREFLKPRARASVSVNGCR
jgi:hypothetical protein